MRAYCFLTSDSVIKMGFFGYTLGLVGGLCEDMVVRNWVEMLVAALESICLLLRNKSII